MKKYKKFTQDLIINDCLIHLLEKEAKKGWFIKSIDYFKITFIKGKPKTLKYQIDYNKYTEEYKNITESLGYKFVCNYEKGAIFSNEDVNADDLYCDELTFNIAILQQFKGRHICESIFWCLFFIWELFKYYNSVYFLSSFHSLYTFLTQTKVYIIMAILALLLIYQIFHTIYLIYMNHYYKKQFNNSYISQLPNYHLMKAHKYLEIIFNALVISIFPIIILSYVRITFNIIIYWIIILDIFLLILLLYLKQSQIIKIIAVFLIFIISFQLYSLKPDKINKDLYYHSKVDNVYIVDNQDILVNQKYIQIFHEKYYENYTICLNKRIAETLFKEEIINLDYQTRRNILSNNNILITKDNCSKVSFNEALSSMKKFDNTYVDTAYYNQDYIICIKDNKVLSFQHHDNLNEIIDYYFKGD